MTHAIPDIRLLNEIGEYYGAGFFESPDAAPIERYSRAWRRWFENAPVPAYGGGRLHPGGPSITLKSAILVPSYYFVFTWNRGGVYEQRASAWTEPQRRAVDVLHAAMEDENRKVEWLNSPHTVGGGGWTHAIINYGRVLAEGLDAYEARVHKGLEKSAGTPTHAFYSGMLDLLTGIRAWHGRQIESLRQTPDGELNRERLIAALERVPFQPARSLYEAMVACNFLFYLDECDNPGRLDQVLWPYYQADPDRAEAVALVREFADNVSATNGWSAALGGTRADGTPAYQEMTEIVLEATRGRHRPSLELRVRKDMPDRLWEAAFDSLVSGNGQPAFYHEEGYLAGLADPALGVAMKDRVEWNGGGCTETMIHGCSNVGSLDAGLNLPLVLVGTLHRVLVDEAATFDGVVRAFYDDLQAVIGDVLGRLNRYFITRARHRPQPLRSLLMDDCLDRGLDFNNGGARYNWSVINVAGLANVADSLEALRRIVFEQQAVSPVRFREVLERNFEGEEPLRRRLAAAPKFGNDEAGVDALAAAVADFTYRQIRAVPCARGGLFIPSHIMFETYANAGRGVGATPDGRRAGEALSDSVGPVQGADTHGYTAMLHSVARLPLRQALGTPVLNMRLLKSSLDGQAARKRLRALIETFFSLGGMQVQLSVLDRAELEDAMIHPERHADLIVRIGGYSTYFNGLSPELKREVLKRTEYAL